MRELSVASAADSFRFLLLEDAFSTSTEGFRRHIWEKRTRRLRVEQNQRDRNGIFRRYAKRRIALWYAGLPISRTPRASEVEAPTYHISVTTEHF
jgi:hypothetical protein